MSKEATHLKPWCNRLLKIKEEDNENPSTPFQRGIIRTLIIIIDGSLAMSEKDLRPQGYL